MAKGAQRRRHANTGTTRSRRKASSGGRTGLFGGLGVGVGVILLIIVKFALKAGAVGAVAYGVFGGKDSYHETETINAGSCLSLEVDLRSPTRIHVATQAQDGKEHIVYWLNRADYQKSQSGQDLSGKILAQTLYVGKSGSDTQPLPSGKNYICFESMDDDATRIHIDVELAH